MLKVLLSLSSVYPLVSVAFLYPSYAIADSTNLEVETVVSSQSSLTSYDQLWKLDTKIPHQQPHDLNLVNNAAIIPPTSIIEETRVKENTFLKPKNQTTLSKQQVKSLPIKLVQNAPTSPITPELIDPNSNQERFPQPTQIPTPLPPNPEQTTPPPTPPSPPSDSSEEQFVVQSVEVTGSSIFGEADFVPLIQPLINQTVTFSELTDAANQITKMYVERGYVTTRAALVRSSLGTGKIVIRVIEGSLEEIQVEGTRRLNPDYIRSRVALGAGAPLNTATLEDQLRLLRINPLLENVEASIRAGGSLGKSILVVRVQEANSFGGSVGIDNYSPPSVGSERLLGSLYYRNLTGSGDELSARFTKTTAGDTYTFDFGYRIPINAMDGTVDVRARINRNEVIQEPFNVLDIRGESELYEISYRQPFIRTPREELALSLGFAYQDGQTFTFAGATPFGFGPDDEGISRTSVIKLAQEYIRRDVYGAWAFRSLFNLGVDVFDATSNSGDIPDGDFFSWLGQIQRVQVLGQDNLLVIQGDIQLTPDSLLPAQQFVIGGGQSVRGYRQNVRAADNGFRLSVEDRITLVRDESGSPYFQVAPFVEMGYVWNSSNNPNFLQDERFIAGLGAGLLWQPAPGFNIKLDWAVPLIDLDDQGNNAQDDGFYFSVNYQF